MLTALIMAGGSGQRFWPLSTEEKPIVNVGKECKFVVHIPKEETEGFTKYIDKALGEGSAYVMHIRPQGAVKVEF